MSGGRRGDARWTVGGGDPGDAPRAAGPWWAGRGLGATGSRRRRTTACDVADGGLARRAPATATATASPAPTDGSRPRRSPVPGAARSLRSGAPARRCRGGARRHVLSAHFFPSAMLTRVLVPVVRAPRDASRRRGGSSARHLDEPWLARLLVLGVHRQGVRVGPAVPHARQLLRRRRRRERVRHLRPPVLGVLARHRPKRRSARSTTSARATSCAGSPASSTTSSAPT